MSDTTCEVNTSFTIRSFPHRGPDCPAGPVVQPDIALPAPMAPPKRTLRMHAFLIVFLKGRLSIVF